MLDEAEQVDALADAGLRRPRTELSRVILVGAARDRQRQAVVLAGEPDEGLEHRRGALVRHEVADEQQPRPAVGGGRLGREHALVDRALDHLDPLGRGSQARACQLRDAAARGDQPVCHLDRRVLHDAADPQQRIAGRGPADLLGEHPERAVQVHDDGRGVLLVAVQLVGEPLGGVVGEVDHVIAALLAERPQRAEHGPRVAEPVGLRPPDRETRSGRAQPVYRQPRFIAARHRGAGGHLLRAGGQHLDLVAELEQAARLDERLRADAADVAGRVLLRDQADAHQPAAPFAGPSRSRSSSSTSTRPVSRKPRARPGYSSSHQKAGHATAK